MSKQVNFSFLSLFNLPQFIKAYPNDFGKVCGTVAPKTLRSLSTLFHPLVPNIKTRNCMKSHILLPIDRALKAPINRLPFKISHPTEYARSFGNVVIKQVNSDMGPFFERNISHAERFVIVVRKQII